MYMTIAEGYSKNQISEREKKNHYRFVFMKIVKSFLRHNFLSFQLQKRCDNGIQFT